MTSPTTQLLHFSQRFRKYCAGQFTPLLAEADLTMREVQVLLFLANNPGCDTARDLVELRGLAKSQVSQAVELLVSRGLLRRVSSCARRTKRTAGWSTWPSRRQERPWPPGARPSRPGAPAGCWRR